MKAYIKKNSTDRYLYPIRKQIIELINPDSSVYDFGCGNGDLLFKLSAKIRKGIGFDNSKSLISYANKRKSLEQINNIDFKLVNLTKDSLTNNPVNYSVASLFFHVLYKKDALRLLQKMIDISEVTIVCGFSKPKTCKQNFLLHLDQRFSSHYPNFTNYKENNYMKGILDSIKNIDIECYSTFDPVIKIYRITKHTKKFT